MPAMTRGPLSLLTQARGLLDDARITPDAGERFRLAHFAALRIAAALIAEHDATPPTRRRLVSVWVQLEKAMPEHAGWANFFAAGAPVRMAIESGANYAVSQAAADAQLQAAEIFLAAVEASVGLLAA